MPTQMIDHALQDGTTTDDITIINGDLATTESTPEHQRQLLLNDKGDYKENPTNCIGLYTYIDDEGLQALARDVAVAFAQDGMTVSNIQLSPSGNLQVDAQY